MKHIDVVIPTRHRLERLLDTLRSIPRADNIRALVIFDDDKESCHALNKMSPEISGAAVTDLPRFETIHSPKHSGSVACRNYAIHTYCNDGVLYATDDIIFKEGCIGLALELFNKRFPDDDGVLGFQQDGTGGSYHESGVALVGQKFLQRYPDKQLFFPGYFHFSCQEIAWLARKVGRFQSDKRLRLTHFHPAFHKHLIDQTHLEARVHSKRDHALIKERQAKGLIWGDAAVEVTNILTDEGIAAVLEQDGSKEMITNIVNRKDAPSD